MVGFMRMTQLHLPARKRTSFPVPEGILLVWFVTEVPNPSDNQQGTFTPAESRRQDSR